MDKTENKTICPVCGVPEYLHATCCGWQNANLILFPKNDEEIQWQKQKLAACDGEIRINKDGVFISMGMVYQMPNVVLNDKPSVATESDSSN